MVEACNCHCGHPAIGIAVLLTGIFILSKDLAWLDTDISVWSVLLVLGGLALIIKSLKKK